MGAFAHEQLSTSRKQRQFSGTWLVSSACLACSLAIGAETPARDARELEEVVVTAQRRAERLEDVPISISVVDGEKLDSSSFVGVAEALSRVPGVATMQASQSGGTQLAVRGVAASAGLFNGASPIAYYLDTAPFGLVKSAIVPDTNAYDLDRIEVLRGPQGTLYGASAQNGVVRILTKDANVEKLEFKVRGAVSTTDGGGENYRGDAAVNVPIIEGKLAARAVMGYQNLSGWIDNPVKNNANDAEIRTGRLKLQAQPTEAFSIGLGAWISRDDYGAPNIAGENSFHLATLDEGVHIDYDIYSAKLLYDVGGISIAAMSSYLDYSNESALDWAALGFVNTRLQTTVDAHMFTQEVTINSPSEGDWRWSFGGIYRDGEDSLFQFRRQYVAPTDLRNSSESYAVFGELTRRLLDGKLELTGGLRYFNDTVTIDEKSRSTVVITPPGLIRSESDFDAVSPRAVVTWHPSDATTIYASYAEGFRSGSDQNGAVIARAPNFVPAKADTLKNYEIGTKGNVLGGRLVYEVAVFYIDWVDVQQTLLVNIGTVANPVNVTALVNAASASGAGAEFSVTGRPIDGLELGVTFSWNDLKLDESVHSGGLVLFNKGERMDFSPEYTAGAALGYSFAVGDGGWQGHFSADATFLSSQTGHAVFPTSVVKAVSDDMLIARTSFSIESPNGWVAMLFADNVNNEDGVAVASPVLAVDNTWDTRVRPRTIGAQLEYRF